ncbi:DUF2294 domain-containing protein [Oscillatoria sp. CS-180]|uniref:DUF2294 domain-containing protein n=1 Tax=Oscillatoria sp. CS-180 TaxID=3021720 RepID=UPI0023308F53|nr:DUF2294 domain-containing protein [Oscillatoria sp. CS-180]MDB9525562.1 DUF2294 domain-containing protein [Oscillatoria sp. CS-180]
MINGDEFKQTKGQLQRALSQGIQKLYKQELGHSTGKVTCHILGDKVTVIIEDSLTKTEQILIDGASSDDIQSDVEQIRSDVDTAIRPKISGLVEEILSIKVVDFLSDTTLETGRTGLVIILAESIG